MYEELSKKYDSIFFNLAYHTTHYYELDFEDVDDVIYSVIKKMCVSIKKITSH